MSLDALVFGADKICHSVTTVDSDDAGRRRSYVNSPAVKSCEMPIFQSLIG